MHLLQYCTIVQRARIRKALLYIFWMIDREFGEPEPTVNFPYIGYFILMLVNVIRSVLN
jgi:hypothetical protein